jgi:release factor glutamine methyltransferase
MRAMCQTLKFSEAVTQGASRLAEAGIEQPRREARLLAAHLLGLAPGIYADPDRLLDAAAWRGLVARRAAREPLAFITGRRGFWTLDLAVSPDTLIPRPDSEVLIEAAQKLFPAPAEVSRILDLGTGTACLLLAALASFPAAYGVGVDRAPAAAALAARNAVSNALSHRAFFLAGDWGDALGGKFDLVLSNPPYIPSADIAGLMPEVACHEPAAALDGGADGLDAYRRLVAILPALLAPGGAAILELGMGQLAAVRALAEQAGLHYLGAEADLAGIARAIKLCRRADAGFWAKKLFGSTAMGS